MDQAKEQLFIVVPCFNEAARFRPQPFREALDRHPGMCILFVDDGSNDGTASVLQPLIHAVADRTHVLVLARNQGKAEAVRLGMLEALARWPMTSYGGYFDADLATPLEEAPRMLTAALPLRPSVIMGSRVNLLGSTDIRRLAHRHYFGRVFASLVSMQLRLPVYDTQCGAKLVRADLVPVLFKEPFLTRWLFDVEILWRCMTLFGHANMAKEVMELPVKQWHEQPGSKVKLSDALRVPFGLWRIAKHYKLGGRRKNSASV